jgi:hypothetical protein
MAARKTAPKKAPAAVEPQDAAPAGLPDQCDPGAVSGEPFQVEMIEVPEQENLIAEFVAWSDTRMREAIEGAKGTEIPDAYDFRIRNVRL